MADQPSSDEILGAIRNSGYLMEQEVASIEERIMPFANAVAEIVRTNPAQFKKQK